MKGDLDESDEVLSSDEVIVTPPVPTEAQELPAKVLKFNMKEDRIAFLKEDNWGNFGYGLRYLDAIASLFHFTTPCTAAVEYKGKIYISYNSKLGKSFESLFNICDLILKRVVDEKSHFEKAQDSILGLYLLNENFFKLVLEGKHICGKYSKILESANTLQDFKESRRDTVKTLQTTDICDIDITSITKKLVNKYFEILKCVDSDTTLSPHKESYFRPLQDSLKLHYYITSGMVNYKEVITLDNPYNLHAEYNISTHFPIIKLLDKNYIGVSKLCCGYCHAYLSEAGHEHRGTHGICDKWTALPGQGKYIMESIDKITKLHKTPNQQKRLSTDKFEGEILILESISLCDYKSSLKLTGDTPESWDYPIIYHHN